MKAPIDERPKNFRELKESKEYKEWVAVLPEYIPIMFRD